MNAQERLHHLIAREHQLLRERVPADREAALLAIIQARNELPSQRCSDLITGRRLHDAGGNKAVQLCFESAAEDTGLDQPGAQWAAQFLRDCGLLVEAELVLGHLESGFMRLIENDDGHFDAWIASKRTPSSWWERADFDWWIAHSRPQPHEPRSAREWLDAVSFQLGYPSDAEIGGASIRQYCEVLEALIARAIERDQSVEEIPELDLANDIATRLGIDPDLTLTILTAYTLDSESAAYHSSVPGIAAAPLVRIGGDRIAISRAGLTTEPLLFLTRELRRRDAEEYHNKAILRESVFRQELYDLFQDKRFVTSSSRIQLRRVEGNVRTDIDAAIFDRRTGTLGIFELKSQDPFARSTAELQRQRDNVLFANRQISGTLDWIKRHGGDEILNRIDRQTAKSFRVHKVFPFVLGRFLAHFSDGAPPDPRAAWGTWPQLLRLLENQPIRPSDANPIASLHNRLAKDPPIISPPLEAPAQETNLGEIKLTIHSSYAAFQKTQSTLA